MQEMGRVYELGECIVMWDWDVLAAMYSLLGTGLREASTIY